MTIQKEKIPELEKKLAEYQGDDCVIDSHTIKETLKNEFENIKFIKTGFPTIDFLTKGFYTGELIIVTGKVKRGKSSFCRTLTKNFYEQGIKSLWFPFDMPYFIFLTSFGPNPPLFYMPKKLKEEAMAWLNARIWEAKVKYDIGAVFIDDLSYLIDLVHSRNPSIELGTLCRQLKRIAIDKNIIMIVTHHVRKTDKVEPTEEDLKDSALVAAIADKVISVQRKLVLGGESNEGQLILHIDRFSGVLQKKIPIYFKDGYFYETPILPPLSTTENLTNI